ncbi:Mut7-C RNAse domain-containing protein [Frateuria soli]|uniref:Mut7-C RNAse domain-containing protein n=1 Tax=Frateuria soli TaxID=1542730 RepID=UPI001E406F21|nr:Mut7-C RNAse domain-containing protein [Frateuria soli]UGB36988.1 Mut7-C RNAse domain-containing protein [Frateuria soli]
MGTHAESVSLFCDAMLASLARWLRAAGYDTGLASVSARDRAVLDACLAQSRILVTRDRHLAAHAPDGIRVVLLAVDGLDAQAAELTVALGIDWTCAPFTRCLLDNTSLHDATPGERTRVAPRARNLPGPFRACPACGRVYWPGSHVRRMQARLEHWNARGGNGAGG